MAVSGTISGRKPAFTETPASWETLFEQGNTWQKPERLLTNLWPYIMGVDFKEGGNWSARRKPSKSGWDRLKLNPHMTLNFVVQVEGVIDVHYASMTSQWVQHTEIIQTLTHPDINPVQQGLTLVNRPEPVFPFGDSFTTVPHNCTIVQADYAHTQPHLLDRKLDRCNRQTGSLQ